MGQIMKFLTLTLSLCILGAPSFASAEEEVHPVDEWIKTQQAKVEEDRQRVEGMEQRSRNSAGNDTNLTPSTVQSEPPQERRLIYKKPTSNVGGRTWR